MLLCLEQLPDKPKQNKAFLSMQVSEKKNPWFVRQEFKVEVAALSEQRLKKKMVSSIKHLRRKSS